MLISNLPGDVILLPPQDDVLSDLKKEGYDNDFDTDPISLYGGDLDLRLNPDAYRVDGKFEVDEPGTPGETEEFFAITYATGVKGFVVEPEEHRVVTYEPQSISVEGCEFLDDALRMEDMPHRTEESVAAGAPKNLL